MTDTDGDKAFLEWKCTGVMPACPGDQRFVGGTEKYSGLSGDTKFQGNFIGKLTLRAGFQERLRAHMLCMAFEGSARHQQTELSFCR